MEDDTFWRERSAESAPESAPEPDNDEQPGWCRECSVAVLEAPFGQKLAAAVNLILTHAHDDHERHRERYEPFDSLPF